jgi:hypothetical protein
MNQSRVGCWFTNLNSFVGIWDSRVDQNHAHPKYFVVVEILDARRRPPDWASFLRGGVRLQLAGRRVPDWPELPE